MSTSHIPQHRLLGTKRMAHFLSTSTRVLPRARFLFHRDNPYTFCFFLPSALATGAMIANEIADDDDDDDDDDVPLLHDESRVGEHHAQIQCAQVPTNVQHLLSRLVPMGFTAEQITAASALLGDAASDADVVAYLLAEDSGNCSPAHVPVFTRSSSRLLWGEAGAPVHSESFERVKAEVQLRAMGFTQAQIAEATRAVGTRSVPTMAEYLFSGQDASASANTTVLADVDPQALKVRHLKRELSAEYHFSEVQVDNAVAALTDEAQSRDPQALRAEAVSAWIEGNLEASMRPSINMIRRKLIEFGLGVEEATRKAHIAHTRTSTLEAAVNYAIYGSVEEGGAATVQREDVITGDLVPAREMYICDCDCQHMLSYVTFFCKIVSDVRDRCVPACPLNAIPNGCQYLLTQKEAEDVIDAVMQNAALRAEVVDDSNMALLDLLPDQMLVNGSRGWRSQLVSTIYMNRVKTQGGFVECPSEGCGWFVEPPARVAGGQGVQDMVEIVCAKCRRRFCSKCRRVFHQQVPCDEMLTHARQWAEWLEDGRPRALERMANDDERFRAALNAFNDARAQHEADMRNRQAQQEQMLADERWKESNCRRCPHCNFVINKLSGCDLMVCGRDYHGNVIQGGCQKSFNWQQARPYIADTGHHPNVQEFDREPPVKALKYEASGAPLLCSVCGEHMQGPHAVCLNCPHWGHEGVHQVCIKCQALTAEQAQQARWGSSGGEEDGSGEYGWPVETMSIDGMRSELHRRGVSTQGIATDGFTQKHDLANAVELARGADLSSPTAGGAGNGSVGHLDTHICRVFID